MRLSELLSPVSGAGTEHESLGVNESEAEREAEAAEIRVIQQRLKELRNQG